MTSDSNFEEFFSDYLDYIINKQRDKEKQNYLYFRVLEYLVVEEGLELIDAQIAAETQVMSEFKLSKWVLPGFLIDRKYTSS